ncbi:LOW QUALITY PROTEIN: probable cinnamyl alcohol dehydrogenase 8B [Oryza glaberrima]|uniref:LOW QUALITY PROTEIN: probable cinnamyl alcohol dehydrogenase 8B n=1 Tax=Oryza glaberrima TaxID=4538 RepID=UPI00224BF129|nr:LOW QUALITY PROTEIN: probable cinnamyl alcohol dehydrogenase 8B [Oryza glaberrima]
MSRHFRTHTTSLLTFPSSSSGELAITRLPFSSSKLLLQQLRSISPAAAATVTITTTSSPARNLKRASATAAAASRGMEEHGKAAVGWAARDDSGVLSPYNFSRRAQKDDDVTIKVLYCGICHTDLHVVKNDWGNAMYPVVPGHEIVGVVTGAGAGVTKFKAGDTVGVGFFVGSCRTCDSCGKGYENYCPTMVITSNGKDYGGAATQGGFSDAIVVNEHYVLRVPAGLPLDGAAPLLCAGVTVYSPMVIHGLNAPGKHVGVVGLGGLGHVAVKFAKAFGMRVTVISTSPGKRREALEHLGADEFLVSRDAGQIAAAAGTMDGILNTVSAWHPVAPLFALMKPMAQMVFVGAPTRPLELPAYAIVPGGKGITGNCVGGIRDCQAMLDFAGEHGITAEVEVIKMDYVNTAMERLEKNDVRYRFVIDVAGSSLGGSGDDKI